MLLLNISKDISIVEGYRELAGLVNQSRFLGSDAYWLEIISTFLERVLTSFMKCILTPICILYRICIFLKGIGIRQSASEGLLVISSR